MSANDKQVGGKHYAKEYQHWDFVTDVKMPYLPACATKYVARWKDKNGIQDLLKSIHYLEKATECRIYTEVSMANSLLVALFIHQLESDEACVISAIYTGHYDEAVYMLQEMISEEEVSESERKLH